MDDSSNPKDAAGRAKLPLHLWPPSATAYGCVGMLEGCTKYGRNNFRATRVAASVYYAAALRHLNAWYEGQDNTDEGGPHLGNALACLAIIVDATVNGTLDDDRQFVVRGDAYATAVDELTRCGKEIVGKFSDRAPKHYDARDSRSS